jgi:hypothetical protein
MRMIRGTYHFFPKRVAFRNDYCLSCQAPRRAIATRTLDVGHIYWIPILPIGFWKHWACSACRCDPHRYPGVRRIFKWAGVCCLAVVGTAFWSMPADPTLGFLSWIFRIVPLGGAVALLINLISTPKEPTLDEKLAAIHPATDSNCPFCTTLLVPGNEGRWSCPSCGVERW